MNNLKYQGGNTGITIPFAGVSVCMDPMAANYGWHCNFGSDVESLCAWEEQEHLACTYEGLLNDLNCTDHTDHMSNPILLATMYDDGCCMMLSCIGEGCTDETACNYNPDVIIDDGSCLTGNYECSDGTWGCDFCGVCGGGGAATYCCDGSGPVCDYDIDCAPSHICGCMDSDACNYDAANTIELENDCYYGIECCGTTHCDENDCPITSCEDFDGDSPFCNHPDSPIDPGECNTYECYGSCNDCWERYCTAYGPEENLCTPGENGNGGCRKCGCAGCGYTYSEGALPLQCP